MNVIKRNGKEVTFDIDRIVRAITKANEEYSELTPEQITDIANKVLMKCKKLNRAINVEEIQDMVEDALIKINAYQVSKHYIKYRYQKDIERKRNTTDTQILTTVNLENEEVKQENSNKNPAIISTQRDYVAGLVSRDLTNRYLLPEDISKAHKEGIIHFHDSDYFIHHIHNCDLWDLEDMLQNGTVINGVKIEKPHSFSTACNVATQIMAIVASSQYGGQTITLSHLAPFVDVSRQRIRREVQNEVAENGLNCTEEVISKITESRLKEEIRKSVQLIQYQILTLNSSNGQTPFVSICMYLNEVSDPVTKADLATIIEEVLKQRIQGIKNESGHWITPAFPKLLYVLEEDNIHRDSKYWYLTELAARCTAKRMVPDYISEKMMKQNKIDKDGNGNCYPCMGAARGDETVTIKVDGEIFEAIPIKQAFQIIKLYTRNQMHSNKLGTLGNYRGQVGVYRITHKPTGLYYIGSSKDLARRAREHNYNIRHKGALGDYYKLEDYDLENYDFEVLETCDLDYLFQTESKWINLQDSKCINSKDPICNGNLTSENRLIALQGQKYSKLEDKKSYTWFRKITDCRVFIFSRGTWQPIRAITYNKVGTDLTMYQITYQKGDEVKKLHITEDHPLYVVGRGRVEARHLHPGDILVSADEQHNYPILEVEATEEDCESFDFEVDNDMFDLSGILSYNCRSFLTPYIEHKVVKDTDHLWDKAISEGAVPDSENKIYPVNITYKCESFNGAIKNHQVQYLQKLEDGSVDIHLSLSRYYSRFNQGVVTLNLPDIALSSKKSEDKFWKLFEERCELAHRALRIRHERLKGTLSDMAPILWQYGALARLKKGETIDKLLYNGYSTISLGYAGLWECVYYMTGKKLTEEEGKEFGLRVMQKLNEFTSKWKVAENIDYSLYGTPIESTTQKFAHCLQQRFGIIPGVTDKNYITNSYHVHVTEHIDAFSKLKLESEFQLLSPGGAISYVEVPNMQDNIPAVEAVIQFIYDNIVYAELNTKSDYCQVCGYDGEIKIVEDENGKLVWECPCCHNRDQSKMNVARRTCGLID